MCKYINISCVYVSGNYTVVIPSMLCCIMIADRREAQRQGEQGEQGQAKYIYYAERLRAREAAGRQGAKR